MSNSRNRESDAEDTGSKIEGNPDDEVDALFKLPLGEFTGARNDLAARLKRGGNADDAKVVKALAKPPVSAWAVNQLYWNHREAFDRLLAAGQRFGDAQASGTGGQTALRESLDERREALSRLSDLATALLSDGGHNAAPDTIHRITTTLEALSAYASLSEGPTPGRLTRDLDPPGFEALASLMTSAGTTKANEEPSRLTPSQQSGSTVTDKRQEAPPSDAVQTVQELEEAGPAEIAAGKVRKLEDLSEEVRRLEESRRARITAAQVSLQDAEKSLTEATARAERLEAAQKKADEEAAESKRAAGLAEKQLRESEERLRKATAALQDAAGRSQSIAAEKKEAEDAVEDARRNVKKASQDLELLSQELEAE
ncbi:MAG TPA: hypothetical protein VKJ45_26410 [Blastocatellia bacterium]|nr:hypothetical protein [Blastocatellia bacterium]